ncbi:hypothetical protein CPAV1605_1162 [seawater metagenome]|uniref:Uncharacterized protein n=1 Tax=seawater metagenome TaxID=1561972 RepID=A0A5E8CJF3_9ZZZZ
MSNDKKKRKFDDINKTNFTIDELQSFDGKNHLEIFNEYVQDIKEFNISIENLSQEKSEKELKDTDSNIVVSRKKIKAIEHNIRYNIHQLNKLVKTMEEVKKNISLGDQSLCDHDKYSEVYYHNERDWYCRKCAWTR